jgi:hypothetical protein
MKLIRFSPHALENLAVRHIERALAEFRLSNAAFS